MYYIDARPMTEAMILGASIPEDPVGAWVAGDYAIGDERYVLEKHRVYKCAIAGASATRPDLDPTRWLDVRPTNLWAPFDIYTKLTKAVATNGSLQFELKARYSTILILDGLEGRDLVVEQLDAPGGSVVFRYPQTGSYRLLSSAKGYWDYAYGQRSRIESVLISGMKFISTAVLRITITAPVGDRCAVGLINYGGLRAVHGVSFGGVLEGATATPVTFTYRPRREDGTYGPTELRPGTKQRSWNVLIDKKRADEALRILSKLSDSPAYIMATLEPGYDGLRGFGTVTRSSVPYTKYPICTVELEDIV